MGKIIRLVFVMVAVMVIGLPTMGVMAQGGDGQPPPDTGWREVIVTLFAFVLGALLGGGGAVVMLRGIVGKVKAEPMMADYLEKLYHAIPSQTLRELLRDLAIIGDKITDGKPNSPPDDPVPTSATFTP